MKIGNSFVWEKGRPSPPASNSEP